MAFLYTADQWLPQPVEIVFAFFANPENLPRLMPPWQQARIEQASYTEPPPHPNPASRIPGPAAGAGTRLTLTFRALPFLPLRLPWDAEISEFTWNDHFCDIQLQRGPFASWKHCHRLTPESRPDPSGAQVPGTHLHDEVHYELPLAPLSTLAHPLIALQLKSTFAFRQTRTAELLSRLTAIKE